MKTKIEHDSHNGDSGKPDFSIETPEDHHVAKERIEALQKSTLDEEAERELEALKQAVARWHEKRRAI